MYHVLTDEEFREYKKVLSECEDLRWWKEKVKKTAVEYIENKVFSDKILIYCDICPLAHIFHDECPTGREKKFNQ